MPVVSSKLNSDLPTSTNSSREIDLESYFSKLGKVIDVAVMRDKSSGKSRGFAFVSFYSKEDAQNAMDNLQGIALNHLILSIEWAKPNKKKGL